MEDLESNQVYLAWKGFNFADFSVKMIQNYKLSNIFLFVKMKFIFQVGDKKGPEATRGLQGRVRAGRAQIQRL
jgi:hypothetical protein